MRLNEKHRRTSGGQHYILHWRQKCIHLTLKPILLIEHNTSVASEAAGVSSFDFETHFTPTELANLFWVQFKHFDTHSPFPAVSE
jgi:hypothetical protein